MLTSVVLLACVIFPLCWILSTAKSSREPPKLKGWLPIIGNAHSFYGDTTHLWNVIKIISKECLNGNFALTIYMGPKKLYVISDPDDVLTVANSCLERGSGYNFAKPCFGEGLVTSSVTVWKQHRKLLNPAFNQKHMFTFLGVFNEQARCLVKNMAMEAEGTPFDHEPYISCIAMQTICTTALGVDFNKSIDLNTYIQSLEAFFNIISERFKKVWLHNDFFWNLTSKRKSQDKHIKVLHGVSNKIIEDKRKKLHKGERYNLDYTGNEFKPFLDMLFELKNCYGEEIFSDQHIRDHVDTFIAAGHDVITVSLVYVLLLIGSYPNVQNKIYAELQEVFGATDRDVEKDDLSRLLYLEAVIKESMRIYPAAPFIGRTTEKDIRLKNYTLRSGYLCILLIYGVHTHPIWGKDLEQFKPERWLDPSKLPKNANAFIAFSLGKQVCIGRSYAMFFMKTVIVHVLRHFRVAGDHNKMVNKFDVMMKPVTGHFISIEKRMPLSK